MNNTVTVNITMLDYAIRYDNGYEPTDEEVSKLINGLFNDNVTADAHLLTHYIVEKYNLTFDMYDIQPHKYIRSCLSDFRIYLNKRLKD